MHDDSAGGGEHRVRLLDGMARAVAAKGYADTTLADIVREAAVSRRTFYEHFVDKAQCFVALYEAASGAALDELRAVIDPLGDWELQVDRAMQTYFAVLSRNPLLLRTLFIEILGLGAAGLQARRRVNQRMAALLLEAVNMWPGRRRRKLPLQPQMAMAVVGGINELVLQAIEQGQGDLRPLADPSGALLRAAIMAEFQQEGPAASGT